MAGEKGRWEGVCVCVINGMCVNCTPPLINQGDKLGEEEEEARGGVRLRER